MNDSVDIELIIDENCIEPRVTIRSKSKNAQVEKIIEAVENASRTDFPYVSAYSGGRRELVLQRDIMRIRTEGRQVVLDTEDKYFIVKQTLTRFE